MEILTKKQKTRRLSESAVMLALSTILSAIPAFSLPFGGSVTIFSQVPIILVSYRYGVKWGAFTGVAMGIIQMLFGLSNFSYVSGMFAYFILVFADYIIAFGALGFGGMFKNIVKSDAISISLGSLAVCIVRFICHFISGVTIWGDYANGVGEVWTYSFTYNLSYMLPETLITVIGAALIVSIFDIKSENIKTKSKNKKVN